MRAILFAIVSVALGVAADKVYYVEDVDSTFVLHEDTGVTNIQSGHLFDAQTVEIESPHDVEKRGLSCSIIFFPGVTACAAHCAIDKCNTAYCEKGICHCTDCQ